jgi:hypothetical protein
MPVKRYTVSMDFQGGSPVVEDEDGNDSYPRDDGTYHKWKFVREEDYDALAAELYKLRMDTMLATMQRIEDKLTWALDAVGERMAVKP